MKKIFAATALLALAGAANAQVDLALWTFEASIPTTGGPHTAEAGVFAATSQASSNTGGTFSNPAGNGSAESFSSNGWDANEYFQFTTSTSSYQGISIIWDQTRSSTGPGNFRLLWSNDGVNFNAVTDYAVLLNDAANGGAWSSINPRVSNYTFTQSLPLGAENAGTLTVRLVALAGGASTGTNRVDNVQIRGTFIPTPGSLALLGLAGLAAARRRRA